MGVPTFELPGLVVNGFCLRCRPLGYEAVNPSLCLCCGSEINAQALILHLELTWTPTVGKMIARRHQKQPKRPLCYILLGSGSSLNHRTPHISGNPKEELDLQGARPAAVAEAEDLSLRFVKSFTCLSPHDIPERLYLNPERRKHVDM